MALFSLAMVETDWPVLTHSHWLINGHGCLHCAQIWLLYIPVYEPEFQISFLRFRLIGILVPFRILAGYSGSGFELDLVYI